MPSLQMINGEPVSIYARISTTSKEQITSLQHQISRLTQKIYDSPAMKLADIYVDFVSGKAGSYRPEWERMLTDANFCRFKKVFTKSVSRFGRDTVEAIQMIHSLRANGVEVIFDNESIHSFSPDFDLAFTAAVAQAEFENVDRSDNIRKGIMMQSENPDSKLYNRKCYGYEHDTAGELVIVESEAEVVRMIFRMYIEGASVIAISNKLQELGIPSPTGKEKWSNRTIDTILQNEKYTGEVVLFKTITGDYPNTKASRLTANKMCCQNHHAAIISKETFRDAQMRRHKKVLKQLSSK